MCEWGRDRETVSPMPAPLKPAACLTRHRSDLAFAGDGRSIVLIITQSASSSAHRLARPGNEPRQRVRGGLCFCFVVVVLCNNALLCSVWFESGDGEICRPCAIQTRRWRCCVPVLCHTQAGVDRHNRPTGLGLGSQGGGSGRWKKQLTLGLLGSSFDDAWPLPLSHCSARDSLPHWERRAGQGGKESGRGRRAVPASCLDSGPG